MVLPFVLKMFNNIMVIMLSKFRSIYKAVAQYFNLLNTIYFSSSDSKALRCLQDKIFMDIFFSEKKKKRFLVQILSGVRGSSFKNSKWAPCGSCRHSQCKPMHCIQVIEGL